MGNFSMEGLIQLSPWVKFSLSKRGLINYIVTSEGGVTGSTYEKYLRSTLA